ncbi:hypothetical protein AAGT10_14760 (plasmid) [Sulfolobus tengchongensis]
MRVSYVNAMIWFILAILIAGFLVGQLGVIQSPPPNLPSNPPSLNATKISLNLKPYFSGLPITINRTALTMNFSKSVLISNGSGEPILNAIIHILTMNATQIAPGPYWEVSDLAGFVYMNKANTTNYLSAVQNLTDIHFYNISLPFYSAEPFIVSYPPSDNVTPSVSSKIVNSFTVEAVIHLSYTTSMYLVKSSSHSVTRCNHEGNTTSCVTYHYVTRWYDMQVSGIAQLLANGVVIADQSFSTTFTWNGGTYGPETLYGSYTVPPGVQKQVYASYELQAGAGENSYWSGNTHYTNYYPTGPTAITPVNTFTWYEYLVVVPLQIQVDNGTSPVTTITLQNSTYKQTWTETGRSISVSPGMLEWTSAPYDFNVSVVTKDHIEYNNQTLYRTWNAGTIEVDPSCYSVSSGSFPGSVIVNYYLNVTMNSNIVQQPSWVFHHVPQQYVYSFNFANNYTNGVGYYYALSKALSQYFDDFQIFEIIHSIQSQMREINETILPVYSLEIKSGSIFDIYTQITVLQFTNYWHNFTSPNGSVLLQAFDYMNISYILIKNGTYNYSGVLTDALIIPNRLPPNISALLVNGTYNYYLWLNYSEPPIQFITSRPIQMQTTFSPIP